MLPPTYVALVLRNLEKVIVFWKVKNQEFYPTYCHITYYMQLLMAIIVCLAASACTFHMCFSFLTIGCLKKFHLPFPFSALISFLRTPISAVSPCQRRQWYLECI